MRSYATLRAMFSKVMTCGLFLVMWVGLSQHALAQDGESLFRGNCASCHKIDQNMTGPALKGVKERWAGKEDLLYQWIKNPAAVKAMNDPYVSAMLKEWEPKGGLMTSQAVSDEDIDAILDYVENWQPAPEEAAQVGGGAATGTGGAEDEGISWVWLVGIALVLLIIIFSLSNVTSALGQAVTEQEGKVPGPELSYGQSVGRWINKHKVFVSILVILLIVGGAVKGYEALMDVGVYEGYTPEQPIAFNHTLHAGENGIACVYCHHGAEESRHAGIPSANVCMNCHKAINEGRTPEGTADIQKIYAAVGWDPETQRYWGGEDPIVWTKVHNLPDHAYFNHAQHVSVGRIACQECHGQMQEDFTVAGQHAPLTMGWCIDCHNQTAVNMEGNGYYDEIHKRLLDGGQAELKQYLEDGTITARELGGWECSKCHY